MKVILLAAGSLPNSYLKEGVNLYAQKLKHYCSFEICEVQLKKGASEDAARQQAIESDLLLAKIKPSDWLVLLDERGKVFTSEAWAAELQNYLNKVRGNLIFCIGGSFGFSPALYERANAKVSFSNMTFNHQMFRLIFLEQLYRGFSILKNEPYHHGG
jgi:23S rRNA (pseudouridine1915-N3)-methyltransferase